MFLALYLRTTREELKLREDKGSPKPRLRMGKTMPLNPSCPLITCRQSLAPPGLPLPADFPQGVQVGFPDLV